VRGHYPHQHTFQLQLVPNFRFLCQDHKRDHIPAHAHQHREKSQRQKIIYQTTALHKESALHSVQLCSNKKSTSLRLSNLHRQPEPRGNKTLASQGLTNNGHESSDSKTLMAKERRRKKAEADFEIKNFNTKTSCKKLFSYLLFLPGGQWSHKL
jgi:hypothetical protein